MTRGDKVRKVIFHNYIFFLVGSLLFLIPSLIAWAWEEEVVQQILSEFKYDIYSTERKRFYGNEK